MEVTFTLLISFVFPLFFFCQKNIRTSTMKILGEILIVLGKIKKIEIEVRENRITSLLTAQARISTLIIGMGIIFI